MNCKPAPEVTCGTLIPETCVTVVDNTIFKGCPAWVDLELESDGCYRQSDLNKIFASGICSAFTLIGSYPTCAPDPVSAGTGILGSIGLGCLEPCDPDLGAPFKPVSTGNQTAKVSAEIQNIYTGLCSLKTSLNNWVDLPLPNDFDLDCLEQKCGGPPPTTLGELLEALVSTVCNCCSTGN